MSGGEQQMVAMARGLMSSPRLILMDEPSLGLSPIMQQEIAVIIKEIHAQGRTIVLVEQNARLALALAQYGYVLETGGVALEGDATELRDDEGVQRTYLGMD
jgi:branched-chain amino acid transport system ATP-binding protein